MRIENVKKVTVIGTGVMGRQIALNTAIYDYSVVLNDIAEAALENARAWTNEYLAGRVQKGKMTREKAEAINTRLIYENDLAGAVADADIIIEAIVEKVAVKQELFSEVSKHCKADAILATNSSNIVSSKLAPSTRNPERVLNMHYFNPALVMKLVEVVQGPHTALESVNVAMEFARKTGKIPIHIKKEIPGFIANRINAAVNREACILLEKGIAGVEEIDLAAELGLGYPMGPFKLMDLTGIDVNYLVRQDRFAASGDEFDRPHPLIVEKYEKGEYGRKTGKGWYEYARE